MSGLKRTETSVINLERLMLFVKQQVLGRCDFVFDQRVIMHGLGLVRLHEVIHQRLVVRAFIFRFWCEERVEVTVMC